nr:ABC transporter ATP-binding protein [uncultured Niameybacter sp.]
MKELLMKKKGQFAIYVLACFLPVIDSLIRMGLFSMMFGGVEKKDMRYFKVLVVLSILAAIVAGGLHIISRLMRIGFMKNILLEIRQQAFNKIINISYKDFSKQSKEVYMSHLINDINTFENNFFVNLLNVIFSGGMYVVCLVILYFMDFKLGIVMTLVSTGMFLFSKLFTGKTEELQEEISKRNEQLTVEIANTFNGLEILKLNGIENKFLDKSLDSINRVEKRKVVFNIFSEQQKSLIMFVSYIVLIGVVIYGGANIESMGFTKVMLVVQLCSSLIFPLVEVLPRMNVIKSSIRIYDKITATEESGEKLEGKNIPFQFNTDIQVENLSFNYGEQTILKEASFKIEKGKKYLIKGVSGAGKSTLMKLLAMIYDEYEGKILVDGKDYAQIEERDFNNKVAFVYQDVFLFEDTIRNNICLYKDKDEGLVLEACRKAGLMDLIEEQAEGLDTVLLENGKNLSGGQRQRISIARAIVKEAELLFVDEGTSALNEDIGKQIEQEILNLDCTVVAISHRYYEGVTTNYDYVLELKNGRVNVYDTRSYFGEVVVC